MLKLLVAFALCVAPAWSLNVNAPPVTRRATIGRWVLSGGGALLIGAGSEAAYAGGLTPIAAKGKANKYTNEASSSSDLK
jgi:hypothetical protein